MSGITDIVQQHLTPDAINQISQAIGEDPAKTQQAVSAAVPMMVGGMAAHASTPEGAATIDNAAENHSGLLGQLGGMLQGGSGGGLLGGLAGMIGGGGQSQAGGGLGGLGGILGGAGGGILGNILGSSHADVTNGVTQATGLDRQKATKLLMILAPIVLAAVAHHRNSGNAAPGNIGQVLQQDAHAEAAKSPQFGGILGGILNKATGQA